MIDPHEIVARTLDGFEATTTDPPGTRTTADGERGVGVLHVPNCPAGGLSSWATVQASDLETPLTTPDGRPVRVELLAAADARLGRFGDAVAACAFAIDPGHDIRPGTVYRNAVANVYPSATTPHLFSVIPFVWSSRFASYDDDDAHVTWLQVVPITESEAQLVADHGAGALEDAFDQAQPDLFAIDRASVFLDDEAPGDSEAPAVSPEPVTDSGEDPVGPLMHAIIGSLGEAGAALGEDLLEDWESFSLLIVLGDEHADCYGFAYGADDAWVRAVPVQAAAFADELEAFLADRYPDGSLPAKVWCQLRLTDGDYGVEFEDRDGPIRWPADSARPERMQRRLTPTFPVLSPLGQAVADAGLTRAWYRWCDADRDWAAEAETDYREDSLRSESGGFAPLTLNEFMDAYRAAGAEVSRGSRYARERNRSFTVDVAAGSVVCSLGVELGRGLNSQECTLLVLADGEEVAGPELLHAMARSGLRSTGVPDPWPHQPYPRPLIGSRSQLEVTAREIVAMLGRVARSWGS